jgi:hypothetical protein
MLHNKKLPFLHFHPFECKRVRMSVNSRTKTLLKAQLSIIFYRSPKRIKKFGDVDLNTFK